MKLLRECAGQDLIEYMLLAAFLGIVGYAGLQVLGGAMRASYGQQNSAMNELWETPPPIRGR